MKKIKRILSVVLILACLCTMSMGITASATDFTDSANDPATKWLTGSEKEKFVYSRPMFDDLPMVTAGDMGIELFGELTDIFAADGKIYLLDSGNTEAQPVGRVVVLDENYKKLDVFSEVYYNGEVLKFDRAKGILVHKGLIYICDTIHNRVLVVDENHNVVHIFEKPTSEMWPSDLNFNPVKIVIDKMDYTYILCDGSFYGAAMFEPDTFEFKGFFGANVVSTTLLGAVNNLWDMLFTNNTKLSKSQKKLPFSFADMVLGADGYLYTCTGRTQTGSTKGAIRRLNPTGNNILVDKSKGEATDSSSVVFGTSETSKSKGMKISHNINSITVDDQNYMYVLDINYGRIYMYDIECNLICTIGGGVGDGAQKGTFRGAKAITSMGDKIYAIDNVKKSIITFEKNQYGKTVQQAQTMTMAGDYTDAAVLWKEVVSLDRNSILAYRGLAKAALLEDRYEEAMEYALMGYDRNTYSQAFDYVRTQFMEQHFTLIFVGAIVLVVAIILLLHYKKKKNIVLIKNKKVKIALGTILHPADTYYEIKRNNNGSVVIATVMLFLWYVGKILGYGSGFIFNKTDIGEANAWYALAQTIGLALLFVCANWLVCVLFEGKGKLKDIYVATCYSIMPLIISSFAYAILANVLTLEEASVITILNGVCMLYTGILLIMSIITVQEFTFGKFIFTTIITLLAMILVVFLAFLIVILLQQSTDFIKTVYLEAVYR